MCYPGAHLLLFVAVVARAGTHAALRTHTEDWDAGGPVVDLKPENVLVATRPALCVKLIDFGQAKYFGRRGGVDATPSDRRFWKVG